MGKAIKGGLNSRAVFILLPLFFVLWLSYNLHQSANFTLLGCGFFCLFSLGIVYSFFNDLTLFWILILALPLSMEAPLGVGDSKIIVPSELIIIVLVITFFCRRVLYSGINRSFLRHPVTVCVLIYAGVLLLTTLTSTMPIVSVKFTIVNLAYIVVFFFLAHELFEKKEKSSVSLYAFYSVPMLFVIGQALYHHAQENFSNDVSGMVVRPYFSDHTIYSACIALLIPMFIALVFYGKTLSLPWNKRAASFIILLTLLAGVYFSYSRAAWIGLMGAFVFFVLLSLRLRFRHIVYLCIFSGIVLYLFNNNIYKNIRQNRDTSTTKFADISEHLGSVTNVSSDASNQERLNRWSCAWRMFKDKPMTGFGPGTYQFAYLPYQRKEEMTRISVTQPYNIPFGYGGSAHSEYLLALSESGFAGFLCMAALFILSVYTGMKVYYSSPDKKIRILAVAVLAGLITYFVHAFFNNFLNIDKAAGLFWGSLSVLVTLDAAGSKRQPAKF